MLSILRKLNEYNKLLYIKIIGIASELITELTIKYGNTFSIINIDKRAKNVTNFFNSIGFENYIEQQEMELNIKDYNYGGL